MTIHKIPTAVYLLHFEKPYKHARHYLGAVKSGINERLERHNTGRGARLIEVITAANITYEIARVWYCSTKDEAFQLERRLKKHSSTRYCPMCKLLNGNR